MEEVQRRGGAGELTRAPGDGGTSLEEGDVLGVGGRGGGKTVEREGATPTFAGGERV